MCGKTARFVQIHWSGIDTNFTVEFWKFWLLKSRTKLNDMFLLCPLNPRRDLSGMKAWGTCGLRMTHPVASFQLHSMAVQCRDTEARPCVLAGEGRAQCLLEGWLQACYWSICGDLRGLFPGCAIVALKSSVQSDGSRHCKERAFFPWCTVRFACIFGINPQQHFEVI